MRTGVVLAACLLTAAATTLCQAQSDPDVPESDRPGAPLDDDRSASSTVDPEAPLPDDPDVEGKLLGIGGPDFRIKRIEHFVIAYDTPEETLRSLRSRLEATYDSVYRFCKINELPAHTPPRKLEVLFFESYEDYGRYAASTGFAYQGSAGFYHQGTNVAAFVNILDLPQMGAINKQIEQCEGRLERLKAARPINRATVKACRDELLFLTRQRDRTVEQINRLTVQHEVAHQVLFNSRMHVRGAQNPGWLVEGMATLFETPPSPSGAGMGATNQMRLGDYRDCLSRGDPRARLVPEDLPVAFDSQQFLRLRDLIGDAQLFHRRSDGNLVHYYTEAWSLVFYLQRTKREQFAEYLRLLAGRKPGETHSYDREVADFEGVFGPPDEQFEQRWARFILDLRYRPSQ